MSSFLKLAIGFCVLLCVLELGTAKPRSRFDATLRDESDFLPESRRSMSSIEKTYKRSFMCQLCCGKKRRYCELQDLISKYNCLCS